MNLNVRANSLCRLLVERADELRVEVLQDPSGARIIDCGVKALGGLEAGLWLARVCMADLATVQISSGPEMLPMVQVHTDQPLLACMASQYAGWEVKGERFFAMGSGPMRAAAAREPLFDHLGYQEQSAQCVGVLESGKLPDEAICRDIAAKCHIEPSGLTLLVAATRSIAGTLQVVARSVETALHKLHELNFDLRRVESAWGSAPLPPPAKDDLTAIGRTNDAILYGGHATLYLRGDDQSLEAIGPLTPSSSSKDYGRPFGEILAAADHDFYRIDPMLFSPAVISMVNLDTGNSFRFGQFNGPVMSQSFGIRQHEFSVKR